jgi:hypothetical protein
MILKEMECRAGWVPRSSSFALRAGTRIRAVAISGPGTGYGNLEGGHPTRIPVFNAPLYVTDLIDVGLRSFGTSALLRPAVLQREQGRGHITSADAS